ncbi:MAG: RNA 3'-phosphate cyclase [Methanoregulaceae archaeon]|nr:RNA 3'-phosphate cyclase [Methanoregulaceae archaeon]
MLLIDGSALEGGGQMVRSAAALSALSGTPFRMENIRAGRERPGLRPQHCAAIRAVAGACGGRLDGCRPDSSELRFFPGTVREADLELEVGTAGSIPLVLQAWLPVVLETGGSLSVTGGTEVPGAPTIEYFLHVLLPVLTSHGARVEAEVKRRGYYPAGGGLVEVAVRPSRIRPIVPDRGTSGIWSCSSGLPGHVTERQAASASRKIERKTGQKLPVTLDPREGPGTGSSCTVFLGCKGGSALGRRGVPAEKVGEAAAGALLEELGSAGAVDRHLADQLLIYLARYGGKYSTSACTLHSRTMCWLLGQFGYKVDVTEGEEVWFHAACA